MTIPVSEQFLSIQGEGPSMGTRAVFLRTHACNLLCGDGKYKDGATWTCDTIPVFSKIKKRYTPEELLADWRDRGWLAELATGVHLVLTGGEPLMLDRQEELIPFLDILDSPLPVGEGQGEGVYIEVETNGTFIPDPKLHRHISHYNVSPKLATSGLPREMRILPEAIRWHSDHPTSFFKFVISDDADVAELVSDFMKPFEIPRHRIWLMPAASTRTELMERQPHVAQLARKNGFNFSTRLHILLYDQVTGV